ncbi:dihydroxyacetone kinase subunit L [Georgenia sp. EYE_87]|uniref:dihydroxyacetone kinase subunit DhaL n=1 Tax=Georgenia sp. EYE_87 TaxID=2853448 RepID=UPI0020032743|nr:dihydroxyacetone kinase subunit DhaL [Georgenia sp. EYE_87]MCK6210654.1 dihydroxyacetone kinase subunit L [Georgenia sp. EYE_87]
MTATTLGADWALDWMERARAVVSANRIELIELDRAIGDGDHGENMDRGFTAVGAKLAEATPSAPGEVLKTVATTLMSTVGGAAGPLYGTAFLRGAKAADGALDAAGVAAVLEAAVEGIQARGKAEAGEKTMVDAWLPAAQAARSAAEGGSGPVEALRAAADAAAAGAEATEPMVARKGRASYLGDRSAGHRDPGAQSSALLLAAAAEAAEAL